MNVEDTLSFEKDVTPYSEIKPPLHYLSMLAKNKNLKRDSVPVK
jgi:hypothetical protein